MGEVRVKCVFHESNSLLLTNFVGWRCDLDHSAGGKGEDGGVIVACDYMLALYAKYGFIDFS